MTDEDILLLLNKGDDTSLFIELYNRYYAQLYNTACKRCSSSEIAEEIVQDLFINLWRNRATIKINSSLSGYLFTAIRNLILNQIQREASRKKAYEAIIPERFDYDNSTEESVMANDLKHHLDINMDSLPDKCRSVFDLSRNHHKSNKQIAFELGISEKTVENHITRALKYLRVSLHHILLSFAIAVFFISGK
ncbi:RNA polymerase, sigma-24 subunit, ECF subfamily [Mucilaginibacter paludis DSM 18603]|uniref:RNA polymerase, sigma-24 subunit, ECF subfamily n=2 Tax=Mucilaginibacter TaxID=423349 RepID=H1Y8V8_9SPHI|nr:RNA polymerase, sigma-24 subunit, ECF subfamily [Mucilaginibacter paludis DSM 18603]